MAIVDQEGRLFGVNLFDAVAGIVVLAMVALGIVGYRLLRVPAAPTIATLTPSTLTSGTDLRIVVTGDNLLPYLRAYVQRTRKPAAVMHDLNPMTMFDNYTLVNYTAARLLIESPQLAEIRPPDNLLPGTYDLVFQNEANIVAVREAAFTVTPAPEPPKRANDPKAIVRVRGAFTGLTKEAAATLTAGLTLPRGAAEPWGAILSVKPPVPAETRLDAGGDRSIVATMADRWQVPAELRAQCDVNGFKCYLPNGVLLTPGGNVSIDTVGTPMMFIVAEILADVPERRAEAAVTIRFQDRPEVLALVHEQDADVSPGGPADPARIVAILRRSERTGDLSESLSDGNIRGTDRVGVLECTARIPMTKLPTGWWYRSQPIKAGAPLTFQTDQYIVRGTIIGAPVFGPDAPRGR